VIDALRSRRGGNDEPDPTADAPTTNGNGTPGVHPVLLDPAAPGGPFEPAA
jgi:hypothetical protein